MMQILERLRQAREQQGLDIEALARRTRLRAHLFEALEEGRFEALPRGVYARAVVRAYAEGVGFDPNRAIAEVASLLPEPEDPLDGLARVRGFERPAQPVAAATPADAPDVVTPPLLPATFARAAGASAIDAAVLIAFTALTTAATAALCGVSVPTLIDLAGRAILAQALVAGGLYFVLLGGIGGGTLGRRLADPDAPRERFRGTLGDAVRRAGLLALREASIVLTAVMPWPSSNRAGDRREAPRSGTRLEAEAPAR